MADIIEKIGEWTGKVIIPHDEALKQKITIYSTRKMPRSKALAMIYTALHNKGFIVEQTDGVIYLKPIKDAKLTSVPTVSAEEPLAAIDNKDMIVQKFFRLKSYSPSRLQELILPLIAEYGYISADETTRSLVIIDTVANLIRIERIIAQLDVSQAGPTVTKVFEIHQGDPVEIVQLLRILVGDGSAKSGGGNKSKKSSSPSKPSDRPSPGGGKPNGPATSVVISARNAPIVLIPEPKRQWIIAKATPDDITQIGEWIEKLDKKEPVDTKHTIIKIQYVNVRELAEHINNTMQKMPGHELRSNVMVLPLEKTRTLMVFGSEDNRQIVQKLIDEIDIQPDRATKAFSERVPKVDGLLASCRPREVIFSWLIARITALTMTCLAGLSSSSIICLTLSIYSGEHSTIIALLRWSGINRIWPMTLLMGSSSSGRRRAEVHQGLYSPGEVLRRSSVFGRVVSFCSSDAAPGA